MIRAGAVIASLLCGAVQAAELDMPSGLRQTAERSSDLDTYAVPVGAFGHGQVPVRVMEGPVVREAWRSDGGSATTLQLLAPLRDQLVAAGYEVLLDCADATCGGFDFRFGIEVLPAPNMVVNLRDYHFVSATRGPSNAPVSAITALVSRTDAAAFLQIIRVGQSKPTGPQTERTNLDVAEVEPPVVTGDMGQALTKSGHAILHDLTFETGSSRLGAGPFASLENVARFLKDNPGIRIALVGHTDAVGSLSGNIALSKARARSVAQVLTETYGIPQAQVEAEGMGYLAPIASNLDKSGRDANRRVEVVLLSSDATSD